MVYVCNYVHVCIIVCIIVYMYFTKAKMFNTQYTGDCKREQS